MRVLYFILYVILYLIAIICGASKDTILLLAMIMLSSHFIVDVRREN